jgi:hypothetical protein
MALIVTDQKDERRDAEIVEKNAIADEALSVAFSPNLGVCAFILSSFRRNRVESAAP